MKTDVKYLKSCLNYTGGKHKLLKQLIPYFPEKIHNFVDLFCGGANVAINVNAKGSIYCIDKQNEVISLFNTLKKFNIEEVLSNIERIISKFELTNTSKYGYEFYGCESGSGLAEYNKEKYKELRDYYNSKSINDSYFDFVFFVLTVFGFNNQIRFNKSGGYNIPVGKRDFNEKIKSNLIEFTEVIKLNDLIFQCKDFRDFDINLSEGDFLYADPPYLISTATYNEQNGWTETEEKDLLNLLDTLDAKGVKFALSNVLEHKGQENTILKKWAAKYEINYLDYNYRNSNYQIKEKASKTSEVLITNYKN
ncbi:hypothetical protein BCJMU51_5472 [Bacillus cereus]|uniref:Dam family site-specific DNA-(adenine-N6)-methyltransferase n=1 Tax=Bacillus cereus TaxID=1396 RepID=UPI001F478C26|nr:DNA adenine methylase [Bacillus cereus]BCB40554.1 hypothetical protein BCM0045_5449 [Bacillus cereus]BCC03390.1 hypothetical protein BCM0057_5472 [Bacillus cereus]BCC26909.1 hypothetical protein BCM0079_5502 [Bacillus cereus]BCC38469.1 hypothetical protein BCM0105_5459 [Bacillus cereus]BCC44267.1 hypothetical protein BCJMU01_5434 [Bacillus cereus]